MRLGEAQNLGPATHERIEQQKNASLAEGASTKRVTQCQAAETPSREESRTCIRQTPRQRTSLFLSQRHPPMPNPGEKCVQPC